MHDDVVKRLQSLGYTVLDGDEWMINFAIEKATWTIKNECNISEIPEGLRAIAIDMACSEFLFVKNGSGQLADFDVSEAIKSIKEGDTQIVYAVGDGAATLDTLISWLRNYGLSQLITYRRFKW